MINDIPMTPSLLGFMLGGAEILVLLVLVAVPVIVVLIVITVVRVSRGRGAPPPLDPPSSAQTRLAELESLRSSRAISESEYADKRRQILDEL